MGDFTRRRPGLPVISAVQAQVVSAVTTSQRVVSASSDLFGTLMVSSSSRGRRGPGGYAFWNRFPSMLKPTKLGRASLTALWLGLTWASQAQAQAERPLVYG